MASKWLIALGLIGVGAVAVYLLLTRKPGAGPIQGSGTDAISSAFAGIAADDPSVARGVTPSGIFQVPSTENRPAAELFLGYGLTGRGGVRDPRIQ